jgi:hypothetical protein
VRKLDGGPRRLSAPRLPNVVRVAPGTGYHRVEGNRRASRDGPVGDLPPEIPSSHDSLTFPSLYAHGPRTASLG